MRGDSDFSPDVCVGQGVGVGNLEGGLSFYLGSPAARRAGCGAAKVPGGGGASAAAAAPPAPSRLRAGGADGQRGGSAKKPNTQTNKQKNHQEKGGNGKVLRGGAAGKALPAAGRAAARGRGRGGSCSAESTAGTPGVTPGPGTEESWPSSAAAPRPGGGRWERR